MVWTNMLEITERENEFARANVEAIGLAEDKIIGNFFQNDDGVLFQGYGVVYKGARRGYDDDVTRHRFQCYYRPIRVQKTTIREGEENATG